MNEKAELLFTQIFMRIVNSFSDIFSFRKYTIEAYPYIKNNVATESHIFAQSLKNDKKMDKFFKDKGGFFEIVGGIENLSPILSQKKVESYQKVIDSSSIILAHSAIDAVAFDCFKVIELVAPINDFEQYLLKKTIPLSDLKESTYQEIVKQKIHKFIDELDRSSLLEKIDKLFQICQPPPQFSSIRNYLYNRKKIEDLDTLRHEIVHGNRLISILPSCDEDITYLRDTANFLLTLIHEKYDVKINPTVWLEFMQNNAKT
jgi:hypothetical protein